MFLNKKEQKKARLASLSLKSKRYNLAFDKYMVLLDSLMEKLSYDMQDEVLAVLSANDALNSIDEDIAYRFGFLLGRLSRK